MKIEPVLPPEPEPLKQDRGCAFTMVILIVAVVVIAVLAWGFLWSGGHQKAAEEIPPTQQKAEVMTTAWAEHFC